MSSTSPRDLQFLQRCVDLAQLPGSQISPNPRVGAVLVYQDRIIGEGNHQQYGASHAEVNCLASVAEKDRPFISASTLYVSLEPCCIYGRTPPCTNLILDHAIPRVIIGQIDQTASVHGKGIAILQEAGVEVISYPYFQPAARVAQARQLYAGQDRPFVLLKYAQSADGFLAPSQQGSYWITSDISRRMVHFWRSRTRAIVVGAGTILADNPQLNTRLYPGPSPLPIIIDLKGEIRRTDFRVFQRAGEEPPILVQPVGIQALDHCDQVVFPVDWLDEIKHWDFRRCQVIASTAKSDAAATKKAAQAFAQKLVSLVMQELHHRKHNHLTVEGGSSILQLFLLANCWDEARVFTGQTTYFTAGLTAPRLPGAPIKTYSLGADQLSVWLNDDSFLT